MVRQWQDMIYDGHRAESDMSDPMAVKDPGDIDIYPDFVTIAKGYRVSAERVIDPAELPAALKRMLANPEEPYLLDVIVEAEANVYPMIPAGGSYKDIIMNDEELERVSRHIQVMRVKMWISRRATHDSDVDSSHTHGIESYVDTASENRRIPAIGAILSGTTADLRKAQPPP
jgi:hypothetical protein